MIRHAASPSCPPPALAGPPRRLPASVPPCLLVSYLSPFLSASSALFGATSVAQLPCIQALPHSFYRHGGVYPLRGTKMNQETAKPSSSVDCPAVTHKVDRYAVADKVDRCVHPDRIGAVTAKNDFPRCRHYTRNGRQCRLRVLDTQSGFCFRHARPQPVQSDSDDLSADLLGQLSAFESASEINQFLARLLVLGPRSGHQRR